MIKALISKILWRWRGKIKYQHLFESLRQAALNGMNIGLGGGNSISGEKFVLEHIRQSLGGDVSLAIFDVGANVGEYTSMAAKTLDNKGHIYTFEPAKKTYDQLVANVGALSNVKHFQIGFGDTSGETTLYSNADGSELASVYKRDLKHHNLQMNHQETIKITTIDEFAEQNDNQHIHLLKVDVEGHEMAVLKGANRMLTENKIDFIQFEFGGANIDSRTFFRDFYELLHSKYRIYRILRDGLHEIPVYHQKLETFLLTNFLAERRSLNNKN